MRQHHGDQVLIVNLFLTIREMGKARVQRVKLVAFDAHAKLSQPMHQRMTA